MARVNVYLPDDLAAQARDAGLNLSALTQEATRHALRARSTDAWLDTLSAVPPQATTHSDALEALDAVRAEPVMRHA